MRSDLGREALLGLVMPLRLFFRRPGARSISTKSLRRRASAFVVERVAGRCGLFGVVAGLTDGGLESRPRLLRLCFRGLGVTPGLLGLGEYCRAGSIGRCPLFRLGLFAGETEVIARFPLPAAGVGHSRQQIRAFGLEVPPPPGRLGLALQALDLDDGDLRTGSGAAFDLLAHLLRGGGRGQRIERRWTDVCNRYKPITQVLGRLHHVVGGAPRSD